MIDRVRGNATIRAAEQAGLRAEATGRAQCEVYPVRERGVQQVAGLSVDQGLGLPGAARGVEQEERVLAVHDLRLAHHLLRLHLLQTRPPKLF